MEGAKKDTGKKSWKGFDLTPTVAFRLTRKLGGSLGVQLHPLLLRSPSYTPLLVTPFGNPPYVKLPALWQWPPRRHGQS